MSRKRLRLVLAAAGVAGAVVLVAPEGAVGEESNVPASDTNVEGTVLLQTEESVQRVPDRLVVGFEDDASSATVSAAIEEVDGTVTARCRRSTRP